MRQLSFDDICRNNHGGNAESEEANATVRKLKAEQRLRVLAEITRRGGATCDELETALGLSHQACSARCSELLARGEVERQGRRATRSGRFAAVLVATVSATAPCTCASSQAGNWADPATWGGRGKI